MLAVNADGRFIQVVIIAGSANLRGRRIQKEISIHEFPRTDWWSGMQEQSKILDSQH